MKSFRNYLTEAFDKPYSYKVTPNARREYKFSETYTFKLDDGRYGSAAVEEWSSGKLSFVFSVGAEIRVTGGGDQFRIYATIGKILDEILTNFEKETDRKFIELEFSADKFNADQSRSGRSAKPDLYTRFANKLARKHNLKVDIDPRPSGITEFYLRAK